MLKKDLLQEVWDLCTFDEIVDAGFLKCKCNSTDVIKYANELDETDQLLYVAENCELRDVIEALRTEHSAREIISEFEPDEVMDCLDNDEMLEYLYDSFTLDRHDDEIRSESYNEGYEEGLKDGESDNLYETDWINIVRNYDVDDKHKFFCNVFEVPYYDNSALLEKYNELFSKFENSIYKNDNAKWEVVRK